MQERSRLVLGGGGAGALELGLLFRVVPVEARVLALEPLRWPVIRRRLHWQGMCDLE